MAPALKLSDFAEITSGAGWTGIHVPADWDPSGKTWTAAPLLLHTKDGRTFTLSAPIAAGTSGSVLLYEDGDRRKVALKVGEKGAACRDTLFYARCARLIDQRCITPRQGVEVRYGDYGYSTYHCLVMEAADASAKKLIASGLSAGAKRKIVDAVHHACVCLLDQGKFYTDLKPANVGIMWAAEARGKLRRSPTTREAIDAGDLAGIKLLDLDSICKLGARNAATYPPPFTWYSFGGGGDYGAVPCDERTAIWQVAVFTVFVYLGRAAALPYDWTKAPQRPDTVAARRANKARFARTRAKLTPENFGPLPLHNLRKCFQDPGAVLDFGLKDLFGAAPPRHGASPRLGAPPRLAASLAVIAASLSDIDACIEQTSADTTFARCEVVDTVVTRFPALRPRLRGQYEPGNLYVGGATCRPRRYAARPGYTKIPIISLGPVPWKALSPFFLGPIGGAQNVENYWQFHKVWETVARQRQIKRPKGGAVRRIWEWPAERHADAATGEVVPAYWKWRAAGFANREAVRRPNGRAIPLYSLFEGERLGLADARRRIYLPAYQAAAARTPEFAQLLGRLRAGKKLLLVDVDGPKLDTHPEGVEADAATLRSWLPREHDEKGRYFPFGHGYALALLLLEYLGVGC